MGLRFYSAVMTADRKVDYLVQTCDSLLAAGWFNPHLIFDNSPRLGPKPTFKRALYDLSAACYEGKWCIVFQDDILVARGLRAWLEHNLPGHGVVSLYTSSVHDCPFDGWHEVDLRPTPENPTPWHNSLGACALMMPCDVARRFLEHDPQFSRTDRVGGAIGEFCFREQIPFWCHSPSLVQHVGEVSCLHGAPITDARRAKRFCADVSTLGRAAELETSVPHTGDCPAPAAVPPSLPDHLLVE